MKLIIDIDEEDFNLIRDNIKSYSLADVLFGAVKDGISYEEGSEGEWIDHSEEGYVECPICEHLTSCDDNIDKLHYCWNCGAYLRKGGAENETDN